MLSPSSLPRQMPLNETTAPMSVLPLASAAISRATSKSASWIWTVTMAVMAMPAFRLTRRLHANRNPPPDQAPGHALLESALSAARHRREKSDLACARDCRIRPDMDVIDRSADHLRLFEGVGMALAAFGQPGDQFGNGADARGRLDRFFRQADALAHPGEIFDPHASSSLMRWWMPARK